MADLTELQMLTKTMRRDPKVVSLKETFSTHETFRLPIATLLDELKTSHKIRLIRRINTTDPAFVDRVVDALLDDQSKRSRATEVIILCVRAHALLEKAVESLRYHLLAKYSDQLRAYKTKEERIQVVNMTLSVFESFLTDVMVLKESAGLLVLDIDKSAWTLKSIIEAIKLHTSRESHV